MVSFLGFIFIYALGGITFLPLIGLFALVYIKGGIEPVLTSLQVKNNKPEEKEVEITKDLENVIVKKGWIRLINQYQPKMPELTQNGSNGSLMSGIQSFTSNNNNNGETKYKKGVVYGVLRHGTLFCFESEKQKEIVMILPVQDYTVSLFAPAFEEKLEGEVYSRTTVIRLVPNGYQKITHDINLTSNSKSATATSIDSVCTLPEEDITCHPSRILYLTCARNIDKEDWYFGLLEAHHMLHDNPKEGPHYVMMDSTRLDQMALEKLIRQIQSTPSQREMSWLNAIIGRVFLASYKTDQLKTYFEAKIRKKIDKTKRPTFLDEIHVRSVDVGDSAPIITDPKLLSLSTDGEVTVEAKMAYSGGLTIEIETDFNWSYSSRMKPIRMHLVLAVTLKKLQGRMMFKIKAPPTNRFWLAFFEMPEMEWKITPVVADKQIKLNLVTNAIESRIREVMAETFVLPNMNDISFSKSQGDKKGGIFGEYKKVQVKKRKVSDGAESIKSQQRANSMQSTSSSSSSSLKSNSDHHRLSNGSSVIRENPTVPEAIVEKTHAMDALKLKNRGAESVSNLLATTDQQQDDSLLVPPRTLETSRSTPDIQPQTELSSDQPSNSTSRWSTSSYLRRRSKVLQTEDNSDPPSDTESIQSNHSSHRFLSKFSNLLPSEQPPSSDSISIRSTTSKKQAILNMAESFLANKRHSRQEDDDDENHLTTSESKKEIYAQRMANMRKRVEEKMRGGKILPPSMSSLIPQENGAPPVKPRRGRANASGNESQDEKPPLPPRKQSIHLDSSPKEATTTQPDNEKKVDDHTMTDDDQNKEVEQPLISKEENIPVMTEEDTSANNDVITASELENDKKDLLSATTQEEEHLPKIVEDYHPPPLPITPRPKRSSVHLEEDNKPAIPPRSTNTQHTVAPPAVPPRSPNQQHAVVPPAVPPRPH